MKEVEEFVLKMDHIVSVDEARVIWFLKKGKPGALPLTSDALSLHVKRIPHQEIAGGSVWKQAHCSGPLSYWDGRKSLTTVLQPLLITQDPIPKAC